MLRPVAAGLMCVGLVTLGVALSRGQEREERDLVGNSDGGTVGGVDEAELQAEGIVISNEDGNVLEGPRDRRGRPGMIARLAGQAQVNDPAAREAIEKIIAGLKDEAKKLESEGKKEESDRKLQAIRALEPLLNPRLSAVIRQAGPT